MDPERMGVWSVNKKNFFQFNGIASHIFKRTSPIDWQAYFSFPSSEFRYA